MKGIYVLALVLAMASGVVQAGPEVAVTFKNNANAKAVYDVVGSSALSYSEANPKPAQEVGPGVSDFSRFRGSLAPDVTTVIFQYSIGGKTCKFKTSYLKLPGRNGGPKWNKSAEAGGGARCEAKITSTSFANHSWAVEFTMR